MMELIRVCDPATDSTCGDFAWNACVDGDLECVQQLAATECALDVSSDIEAAACVSLLGGPEGVCGANACSTADDCAAGATCVDNLCVCATDDQCPITDRCDAGTCVPAPCGPCGPGTTCQHGTCE